MFFWHFCNEAVVERMFSKAVLKQIYRTIIKGLSKYVFLYSGWIIRTSTQQVAHNITFFSQHYLILHLFIFSKLLSKTKQEWWIFFFEQISVDVICISCSADSIRIRKTPEFLLPTFDLIYSCPRHGKTFGKELHKWRKVYKVEGDVIQGCT